MARKRTTIPASTKLFYKIVMIQKSFHGEFISLPTYKIEGYHDKLFSLFLNEIVFTMELFIFTHISDLQEVFLAGVDLLSIRQIRKVLVWLFLITER